MNNINDLITIIESKNGSASLEELALFFQKKYKMYVDRNHLIVIKNTLLQNKKLVRFNPAIQKWEIRKNDDKYLRVDDDVYFETIESVMNNVFGISSFQRRVAYLKVQNNCRVWFPKFDNEKWKNEYSVDGRFWYETPLEEVDYTPDDELRYVFSYDMDKKYKFTGVFKPIENQGNTRIYELVDDKVKIINRNPMIICRISWMKNYQGITTDDTPVGAGKYVMENQDAYEKYNFYLREDAKYYGFVETKETKEGSGIFNKISLENITFKGIGASRIDGVRVVFVSPHPASKELLIVGWYDNATIFRERQDYNGNIYMMYCEKNNAHLINVNERKFVVPSGKNGVGMSNFFYIQNAVEQYEMELNINDYIDSVLYGKDYKFDCDYRKGFEIFLDSKVKNGEFKLGTKSTYISAMNSLNKQLFGTSMNKSIFEISDIKFLENLYNELMDESTVIGKENHKNKRQKSSAVKLYMEYLESR